MKLELPVPDFVDLCAKVSEVSTPKLTPKALAAAELVRSAALILSADGDPCAIHGMIDRALGDALEERLNAARALACDNTVDV